MPSPRTHSQPQDNRLCVGAIAGARGLRGEVRVRSFTDVPEDIASYRPLTDASGEREFHLHIVGHHKDQLIARVEGVEDRTAAEALGRVELFVPRTVLPEPEEGEFYHADLIGLSAELAEGGILGVVRAVHDFGAGTLLEIRKPDGRDAMVPFTNLVVPTVDMAGGRIVVAPPPGLLDETANESEHVA
jgi:16S rRNA processing protein RimM